MIGENNHMIEDVNDPNMLSYAALIADKFSFRTRIAGKWLSIASESLPHADIGFYVSSNRKESANITQKPI